MNQTLEEKARILRNNVETSLVRGTLTVMLENHAAEGIANDLQRAHDQVDALDHIRRVCENARQSTRRIRWIIERAKSALAGDNNWQTVEIPRHDPAVERLENMIVAVYPIAKAELAARRELYDCLDVDIPDAAIRREIEILDRFVREAPHVSAAVRQAEGGN